MHTMRRLPPLCALLLALALAASACSDEPSEEGGAATTATDGSGTGDEPEDGPDEGGGDRTLEEVTALDLQGLSDVFVLGSEAVALVDGDELLVWSFEDGATPVRATEVLENPDGGFADVCGRFLVGSTGIPEVGLRAVDVSTGETAWEVPATEADVAREVEWSPFCGGEGRVIGWQAPDSGADRFTVYDLADGEELWSTEVAGYDSSTIAGDALVLSRSRDEGGYAVEAYELDSGEPRWTVELEDLSGLRLSGPYGVVIEVDDDYRLLDAADGTELLAIPADVGELFEGDAALVGDADHPGVVAFTGGVTLADGEVVELADVADDVEEVVGAGPDGLLWILTTDGELALIDLVAGRTVASTPIEADPRAVRGEVALLDDGTVLRAR
jgi:outer membrane protein assembly factor BamB